MVKAVRPSIKKYYNFKNLLAFLLLEAAFIFVTLLFVQSTSNLMRTCKTASVNLNGSLESEGAKFYTLEYSGNGNCYLVVTRGSGENDTSLWLYKPNGSIEVLGQGINESSNLLLLSDVQNGKYRVSVKNRTTQRQDFDINLLLAAN